MWYNQKKKKEKKTGYFLVHYLRIIILVMNFKCEDHFYFFL